MPDASSKRQFRDWDAFIRRGGGEKDQYRQASRRDTVKVPDQKFKREGASPPFSSLNMSIVFNGTVISCTQGHDIEKGYQT